MHIFNPIHIDNMREKISFVINNKGVRDKLVKKGEMRLQHFSLQNTIELTRQSYTKALQNY